VAAYLPGRNAATDYRGVWLAAGTALAIFGAAVAVLRRNPRGWASIAVAVAALLVAGFGVEVTGGARSYEDSLPLVMFFLVSATYPPRTSFLLGLLTAGILTAINLTGPSPSDGLHRVVFQVPAVLVVGLYASFLYQDLNRERRQRRQMAEIAAAGRDLTALEVDAALSALVRHLQGITRADEVAIFLKEGQELPCARQWVGPAFAGSVGRPPNTGDLRVGQGLVGWAAAQRRAALVADTRSDPRVEAPPARAREALACIVAPLLAPRPGSGSAAPSEEVVGVIRVARLGAASLDAADLRTVEVLAAQAALAIANARLFEQVRQQSLVDATTGRFNARYLALRLEDELARARRRRLPLTLAFIDSDSLKVVNDRFGHQRGDELVREVAAQIRRAIRAEDIPIRYAGDEFIVVMPDTPVEAALAVMSRLRAAVAETGRAFGGIVSTVSIGLAGYPDHARSAEDLVRLADHAMYAAKAAGKNRCVVWSETAV
jgi:diguanylate cyclase (GGDEF)-like protein